MAIIGCSYVKVAKYAASGTTVTYTNPAIIAKLVRLSITLDSGSENDFYADNTIDETDNAFGGGSLEIETNDLTNEASKLILGLASASLSSISGVTDEGVEEIIFDDRQITPYLGFGAVIKHKRAGAYVFTGVVLPKIMFNIPEDAAETQGQSISWQTPTLSARIMKDDTAYHAWKMKATFSTEAQAIAYVNAKTGGVAA